MFDKDTDKLYVQFFKTQATLNLSITARMSWYMSEILMPFKKPLSFASRF